MAPNSRKIKAGHLHEAASLTAFKAEYCRAFSQGSSRSSFSIDEGRARRAYAWSAA